jgi:2-polyprenyl-6-methoxyphenol hydroxylase-like FAD-dependent oxidoreductase
VKEKKMEGSDEVIYDVCVIGMGIGGLATALALQQEGLTVFISEKDHVLSDRKQGYGLTLTNSLTGPLAKLGLLKECIEINCPSHSHFTFDSNGNILGYYGRSVKNLLYLNEISLPGQGIASEEDNNQEFGGSRGNLRVPRQDLRQLMLRRLNQSSLHWGCRFLQFEESSSEFVTTFFEITRPDDSTPVTVAVKSRILVGADGIRSSVRCQRDELLRQTSSSPLQYVGVSVILGISEIDHPLLRNKGYYVIDGTQRMFTMPFLTPAEGTFSDCASASVGVQAENKRRQIMWQLSFSDATESDGRNLRSSEHSKIMELALQRTANWFPAVTDLIQSTLLGEIWATPLYDRNAMIVLRGKEQSLSGAGRVTVLGDACHPMSMFKGQGANQALEDSVLLASKLQQRLADMKRRTQKRKLSEVNGESEGSRDICDSSLAEISEESMSNLLRTFEREMIGRTDKKVQASRAAAKLYHSNHVFNEPIGIQGVSNDQFPSVLRFLKENKIDANLGDELEDSMSNSIASFYKSLPVHIHSSS